MLLKIAGWWQILAEAAPCGGPSQESSGQVGYTPVKGKTRTPRAIKVGAEGHKVNGLIADGRL